MSSNQNVVLLPPVEEQSSPTERTATRGPEGLTAQLIPILFAFLISLLPEIGLLLIVCYRTWKRQ